MRNLIKDLIISYEKNHKKEICVGNISTDQVYLCSDDKYRILNTKIRELDLCKEEKFSVESVYKDLKAFGMMLLGMLIDEFPSKYSKGYNKRESLSLLLKYSWQRINRQLEEFLLNLITVDSNSNLNEIYRNHYISKVLFYLRKLKFILFFY